MDEDAEAALEQAGEIISLIDDEVPDKAKDRAPEFFEDVREKVSSMIATLEKTGRVTPKQQTALDNWEAGVRKWIR